MSFFKTSSIESTGKRSTTSGEGLASDSELNRRMKVADVIRNTCVSAKSATNEYAADKCV
jgi:hypothetical protein